MIMVLIGILVIALSWVTCVGVMYLICLCLPLEFDLLIATGI